LEVDKSSVESLSYLDLREVSDEDYVAIPKNENEYLFGIENVVGYDIDKAVLISGDVEINSLKTFTDKEGKTRTLFSIPRGTNSISMRLLDGSAKDISGFLPEEEPENKFLEYKQGMVCDYNGSDKVRVDSFDKVNRYGHRDGPNDTVHWLPDLIEGEARFSILLYNLQGDIDKVLEVAEYSRLIDASNPNSQQSPEIINNGWGKSKGAVTWLFDHMPTPQSGVYAYLPGIGILVPDFGN
jgi:hypothetical protein